jgi:hypothetical protein
MEQIDTCGSISSQLSMLTSLWHYSISDMISDGASEPYDMHKNNRASYLAH